MASPLKVMAGPLKVMASPLNVRAGSLKVTTSRGHLLSYLKDQRALKYSTLLYSVHYKVMLHFWRKK